MRYGGTPNPHAGPQLQGALHVSEPVQGPVGGLDPERPHGLLAEHAVQGVGELGAQSHRPADEGPPRSGIHKGDPQGRPEPRVGLGRQGDRRRYNPFGRRREVPVVRGRPGPGQGGTKPGAEDEQRPFDDERELGRGMAHGRFVMPVHAAGRKDQLMDPEAVLVLRPLQPGDASRRVSPIQEIPGCAAVGHRRDHRIVRRTWSGANPAGRSRLTSPQQAPEPVEGSILRMAIHGALRRLPSVPVQS